MQEKWYALKIQGFLRDTIIYPDRDSAERDAAAYGWVEVVEVDFEGRPLE